MPHKGRWKIFKDPRFYVSLSIGSLIFLWIYSGKDTSVLSALLTSWTVVAVIVIILFKKDLEKVIGQVRLRIGELELDLTGIREEERGAVQKAILKNFGKEFAQHINFLYLNAEVKIYLDDNQGAQVERRATVKAVRDNVVVLGIARILSDGEIADFKFEIEEGLYKPSYEFNPPILKDKSEGIFEAFFESLEPERPFSYIATMYLKESYGKEKEHWTETVIWPTNKVAIKVCFPENHPPKEVEAFSGWQELPSAKKSEMLYLSKDDENRLFVQKTWVDPIIGGHFGIRWLWTPPPKPT